MMMKENVRQAGSDFSTLEKVIVFSSFVTSGEKSEQDISSCTKLLAFFFYECCRLTFALAASRCEYF